MKVVYVAGPFRGHSAWEIEGNIRRAEALALAIWRTGLAAVICPHANTRFFQDAAPDWMWLDGDLELLRRCDAVVLTPDWARSHGARAERRLALDIGIQVFEMKSVVDEPVKLSPNLLDWLGWKPGQRFRRQGAQ
jgi:hypothetical protein